MKVFLHIGTEKTGSSFIQALCATRRDQLAQSSVFFPSGSRYDERSMATGNISAGNARDLAERIREDRWSEVRGILRDVTLAASERRCDAVLLSSEWLLGSLAEGSRLNTFVRMVEETGSEASFLLVLRDPVEQFLSLYKHRAKRGTAGTVSEWSDAGYRLPAQLAGFRKQAAQTNAELVVRQYSREQGALERLFFEEWLGVPRPEAEIPHTVNPSLALSELELLRMLGQRRPDLVDFLYQRLLGLEQKGKRQGQALEGYARNVAERAVHAHRAEWEAWNAFLPENERLSIREPRGDLPAEPQELGFSREQMECLMAFLSDAARPGFLVRLLWLSKIRPRLGRVRHAVVNAWRPR